MCYELDEAGDRWLLESFYALMSRVVSHPPLMLASDNVYVDIPLDFSWPSFMEKVGRDSLLEHNLLNDISTSGGHEKRSRSKVVLLSMIQGPGHIVVNGSFEGLGSGVWGNFFGS
jgi:hypothetical protein